MSATVGGAAVQGLQKVKTSRYTGRQLGRVLSQESGAAPRRVRSLTPDFRLAPRSVSGTTPDFRPAPRSVSGAMPDFRPAPRSVSGVVPDFRPAPRRVSGAAPESGVTRRRLPPATPESGVTTRKLVRGRKKSGTAFMGAGMDCLMRPMALVNCLPSNLRGSHSPTGEPDARNLPVRFGGSGDATHCAVPTSIFPR